MATVQEQFDAFMKTQKSKQAHVPILVQEFTQGDNEITFEYNGTKLKVPNSIVLSPSPKTQISNTDYIDVATKSVLLIIKGTISLGLPHQDPNSLICTLTPTCRIPGTSVKNPVPYNVRPQITDIEHFEKLVPSLHIYLPEIKS